MKSKQAAQLQHHPSSVTASNFFAPEAAFKFLLSSSGAIALLVYLVIAISQLRMRAENRNIVAHHTCQMWLYPYLTWAVIIAISGVIITMLVLPTFRSEVTSTALLALALIVLGTIKNKSTKKIVMAGA